MKKNKVYISTYKLTQILTPLITILFILCLLLFSKTSFNSALNGIRLWLWVVVPALFPFFVSSEILNSTGFIKAIGIILEPIMRPLFNVPGCGSFAFAMGISSGYPVGAKITADMRSNGMLTKTEAERLLCFTNNSGPLFMIGAVAVGMYGIPILGTLLMLCHYLACITVGIIFRYYKKYGIQYHPSCKSKNTICKLFKKAVKELIEPHHTNYPQQYSFGFILSESVKNSINLLLIIGGFITIFSVVINLLLHSGTIKTIAGILSPLLSLIGISKQMVPPVISGFFEITTGTSLISKVTCIPLIQQIAITSFVMGWAGLSVHCQVISIISKTDISIFPYLIAKFLQGIFASIYTILFLKFTNWFPLTELTVFQTDNAISINNIIKYTGFSIKLLALSLFTLLLLCIVIVTFLKIFPPLTNKNK